MIIKTTNYIRSYELALDIDCQYPLSDCKCGDVRWVSYDSLIDWINNYPANNRSRKHVLKDLFNELHKDDL